MNKPVVWVFDKLMKEMANFSHPVVWTLPCLGEIVKDTFPFPICYFPDNPSQEFEPLIVIGGGSLIDKAKIFRMENAPHASLIVIPSIWGSGAENSPIAVEQIEGKKIIHKRMELLPDIRLIWPQLASRIPEFLTHYASGDVWSHALEGFFSPLAHDCLREDLAQVIKKLMHTPRKNHFKWFELSARACAMQAQSSVGLVHGIAHILEGILKRNYPDKYFGHAQLCSLFLWPVFTLNMKFLKKIDYLLSRYRIDGQDVLTQLKGFFDEDNYKIALPFLAKNWKTILHDPCTRTNCLLVRSDHLSYFIESKFE